MRIPPYYRMPEWQRFLAGCLIGVFIGFALFLLIYGSAQEKQINKIREQRAEIQILEEQKEALLEAEERKNKDLERQLTIQEVAIEISDSQLDHATKTELENTVSDELHSITGQSIATVADNRELIERAVEGKPFVVSDVTYHFKIRSIVLFSTVTIQLEVSGKKDNVR